MRMVVSLMMMVVMLLMMMVVVMVMAIVMMMVMVVCLVKIALARRRDVGVLSHHMKILALRFYWRRNEKSWIYQCTLLLDFLFKAEVPQSARLSAGGVT